jgi:2-polyprenyl-3-methyl-5-hydroxy-6-metoxy-1,4-benzoquinol methylase
MLPRELVNNNGSPVACPVCDTSITHADLPRQYQAPFNAQNYTLHRCGNCDLGFWTPLKIDPAFYEDEGFSAYADYHQGARPFPPWCVPFFNKTTVSRGRLLDVGCGDGAFLSIAREIGFEVWGMDLDKNSVNAAMTGYGLGNITQSSLAAFVETCKEKTLSFDVITFFEVLEHQDHPSEFIDQVMSILKPDGLIAGSVPNGRRFLADLDRRISPGDLPPHHFLWFSTRTLTRLFQRKKFSSILIHPSGNITLAQLRRKFAALIYRKIAAPNPSTLMRIMLFPFIQCAAFFIWLGYRARPAHLYFQATMPRRVN